MADMIPSVKFSLTIQQCDTLRLTIVRDYAAACAEYKARHGTERNAVWQHISRLESLAALFNANIEKKE